MDHQGEADWAGARQCYEAAACTRAGVARKYAVSYSDLLVRARINKWSEARRNSSTDRMILADRMLGLIELQIEQMEKREMTSTGEKEAAVLGKLTESIGKLIGFAKIEAQDAGGKLETAEMGAIRQQLAKRIDALTKG